MTMLLTDRTDTNPEPLIVGKNCPLCGGEGRLYAENPDGGASLRTCCGNLLSWQWDSVKAYERLYTEPDAYHVEAQLAEGQRPSFERDTEHLTAASARLALLKQWIPNGRLCDVGCGTGAFVAAAQAEGYEASGVDPCLELVEFGRSIGRNLHCGTWESLRDTETVLTLHDVLEHLTQPMECLSYLAKNLLGPSGLIVVETPEFHSPFGGWERHIRPLQHVCLYSELSARELFHRAGLRVEMMCRPLRGSIGKIAFYLSKVK